MIISAPGHSLSLLGTALEPVKPGRKPGTPEGGFKTTSLSFSHSKGGDRPRVRAPMAGFHRALSYPGDLGLPGKSSLQRAASMAQHIHLRASTFLSAEILPFFFLSSLAVLPHASNACVSSLPTSTALFFPATKIIVKTDCFFFSIEDGQCSMNHLWNPVHVSVCLTNSRTLVQLDSALPTC